MKAHEKRLRDNCDSCNRAIDLPALRAEVRKWKRETKKARAEAERFRQAILWADGLNGKFRPQEEGEGRYWWRTELMDRARPLLAPVTLRLKPKVKRLTNHSCGTTSSDEQVLCDDPKCPRSRNFKVKR